MLKHEETQEKKCELKLKEHFISKPFTPVVDIHTHFGRMLLGEDYASCYNMAEVVAALKDYGMQAVVNLDGEYDEYFDRMLRKTQGFEDFIITFGSLDLTRFEKPDFERYVRKTIERQISLGMRGMKFWKTLGLSIKDGRGNYLRVDDKRLEVIWHTAAEYRLPVLIHIADPTAFFKPIDLRNERIEELQAYPEYSFYNEGRYTFDQLMEMQENLLARNRQTTFVVAHFGSYSENLAQVGQWLDSYDNMYIDIAERISDLGRQPYTSRKFFERYQDRIMFGTDLNPLDIQRYPIYYRFLETFDEYFNYGTAPVPHQGIWNIYGIGLDEGVLNKVYRDNAVKLLHI